MAQHFNSRAQLLILLILSGAKLLEWIIPPIPGWSLILDFISVFTIVYLLGGYFSFARKNFRKIPRLLSAWAATGESRRLLSIIREFSMWVSVGFLGLRISRWTEGWQAGIELEGVLHFNNYFSASILFMGISWMLSLKKVQHRLRDLQYTSGRKLLFSYILLALMATIFLMLPFSLQPGKVLSLVDASFIVVSAISVTGLVPVNIAETLSLPGQFLILFLIQIGGLGIIMLSAALAAATFKKLSLAHSLVSKELYDIPDIGNMAQFLTKVFVLTLGIEFVGALLLFFSLPVEMNERLFHAIFHAVSAFCNAGFSSFPTNLENSPMGLGGMGVIGFLVVLGGLGFPVLIDLLQSLRNAKCYRSLNANTRLTLWTVATLLFLGTAGIFLMESFSPVMGGKTWLNNLGTAIFYSVSARTAGFNHLPMNDLGMTSIVVLILLMVVGGSPLSTAGGLKTTTVGVLVAAAWSSLRGLQWTQFGNRMIANKTIMRALTGLVLYVLVSMTAILLLTVTERMDPWIIIFEVISAMSTVGLSLGATPELSSFGKMLVMFLMMAGRIGLVTFMYAGIGNRQSQRYRVPQDQFFIG